MDKNAVKPVPDAEAEHIVRALAEQLRWDARGRHTWAVVTMPGGERRRYFVHERTVTDGAGPAYRYDAELLVANDYRKNAPGYPTQADAKAACERHHATGIWEA